MNGVPPVPDTLDDPPTAEPYGPEDRDGYVIIAPGEKPYTVIVASVDAIHLRVSVRTGMVVVHVHANTPRGAGIAAVRIAQNTVKSKLWSMAEPIFVTEGHHLDPRVDTVAPS